MVYSRRMGKFPSMSDQNVTKTATARNRIYHLLKRIPGANSMRVTARKLEITIRSSWINTMGIWIRPSSS